MSNNTDSSPAQTTTTQYGPLAGTVSIARRSGAMQATSLISATASASYNSADIENMRAALVEVMATLTAINLWKGGA